MGRVLRVLFWAAQCVADEMSRYPDLYVEEPGLGRFLPLSEIAANLACDSMGGDGVIPVSEDTWREEFEDIDEMIDEYYKLYETEEKSLDE